MCRSGGMRKGGFKRGDRQRRRHSKCNEVIGSIEEIQPMNEAHYKVDGGNYISAFSDEIQLLYVCVTQIKDSPNRLFVFYSLFYRSLILYAPARFTLFNTAQFGFDLKQNISIASYVSSNVLIAPVQLILCFFVAYLVDRRSRCCSRFYRSEIISRENIFNLSLVELFTPSAWFRE